MIERLSDRVWVVPGGVNIGVLRGEGDQLVLVDTGINETAAKKALKAAREEIGGEVVAILTTHGHADHFGGNQAVVKRTGATVYAPAFDEAVLRHPILQPSLLYGGADPIETMRGGFMLAKPSQVDVVLTPGELTVAGIPVTAIPLFGHSPGQLGYLVDGILFSADVVLPATVLEKYKIPYLYSLTDHLGALALTRTIAYDRAVPGHGPVVADLAPLLDQNEALIDGVLAAVREIVRVPTSSEAVMEQLLARFGHVALDAPAYYLLQPTVLAFLTHLHRQGRVSHEIHRNRPCWTAV